MFLLALLSLVAILSPPGVGAAVSRTVEDAGQENPGINPCLTPECVASAARIREFMDPTVDPCENFYDFACGGWMKNQVLPPYKQTVTSFEDIDKMVASVRNLFDTLPKWSDLSSVRKAKDLFASCMHYEQERNSQALVDFVNEEFGGWPLTLDQWDDSQFDLEHFLKQAFRYGVSPLFSFGVEAQWEEDENGTSVEYHSLIISTPQFGLPDESWYDLPRDHVTFRAYESKIAEIVSTFEVEDGDKAWDDIQELLDMETALAKLSLSAKAIAVDIDLENMTTTLWDVQDQYGDAINWTSFITNIMASPEVGVTDIKDDEMIINKVPNYFENITGYLQILSKRTIANYIVWRVVDTLENVLVPENDKVDLLYKEAVYGRPSSPPAEETCVDYISKAFELVVHRLLYADKFPEEEIRMIQEMMKEIQIAFDDILEETDWLDEYTKIAIKEKNAAVVTTFVYFDRVMNDTYLNNYYANMTFDRENFFGNLLVERQETVKKNLRLLRQPVSYTEESLPYHQAAFNSFYENTIKYSAAVFEPPVFSRHVPQSLNYGAMGSTLGHELTHAFDNDGYKFSKEGRSGEWWSEQAILNFEARHKCMVDQYSDFYLEEAGMYVDGNLTLGENIADNGGLRESFRAYRKYVCSRGMEEPGLPSLNFTQNQLFFINFAQSWCTLMNKEYAQWLVTEDPHSPAEFRVIGSVQNSEEFAQVFNCPAGSYMNPQEKCVVW